MGELAVPRKSGFILTLALSFHFRLPITSDTTFSITREAVSATAIALIALAATRLKVMSNFFRVDIVGSQYVDRIAKRHRAAPHEVQCCALTVTERGTRKSSNASRVPRK